MKDHSKLMTALVAALLVSAPSGAQTAAKPHATTHKKTRRSTSAARRTVRRQPVESAQAREMRELREQLSGQQVQIDALKNQLSTRDQQVVAAQQSAAEAQQQVASAAAATAAAAAQTTQNAQKPTSWEPAPAPTITRATAMCCGNGRSGVRRRTRTVCV